MFVEVRSYDNYIEAHLMLGRLRDEYINCHLLNENYGGLNPGHASIYGGEIRLIIKDEDAEIRKAAIRISEQFLVKQNAIVLSQLENLKTDKNYGDRIQLALSLRYSKDPKALGILKELQNTNANNPLLVKAASRSMQEKDESLAELRASTMGMDEEDRDLVFNGAGNFKQLCATCHGMDGKGLATMVAPPLAGSARVNGEQDILINIVLHGLNGPVDNKTYPGGMVAQKEHTDEYVASVLSYIRNSFGNKQDVVSVDDVKKIRAATSGRQTAWTLEELNDWQKKSQKK